MHRLSKTAPLVPAEPKSADRGVAAPATLATAGANLFAEGV